MQRLIFNGDFFMRLDIASFILSLLSIVFSVSIGYMQYRLQAKQTELQEQQSRIQTLQSLPILTIKRKTINAENGDTEIEICLTDTEASMISGFKAQWLSEFGKYPLTSYDLKKTKQLQFAVIDAEEAVWDTKFNNSGKRCATRREPNWKPILNFIRNTRATPDGYSYWHRYDALITVHQRDNTGIEFKRYYQFVHERPFDAQLISEVEAAQWLNEYESSIDNKRQLTILNSDTNLDMLRVFLKSE
jgi:hypothetical protein